MIFYTQIYGLSCVICTLSLCTCVIQKYVCKLCICMFGGGYILYIRFFTRHVLSANSSLKSCIKSTRVNFSQNLSENFKNYFICKIKSNLRDWIFHNFDTLANIVENGCTRRKPDIQYLTFLILYLYKSMLTEARCGS